MKKEIIGILVCLMLMSTYLAVAKNDEKGNVYQEQHGQTTVIFGDDVPVPIWTVGDYWHYQVKDIVLDLELEGFLVHMALWTDEASLTVVGDTGDFYTIEFNATLNGNGYIFTDFGDGPINITGVLKDTKLTGTILFNKSDLGIKRVEVNLDGNINLDIIQNPYIPKTISIKLPAAINVSVDSSVPYPLIKFPLNVTNAWGLPATNISFDGTIKSPWLNFMNRLNNFAQKHWTLVEIIIGLINKTHIFPPIDPAVLKNISDILYDILPTIHIGYVLRKYVGIEPVVHFPAVPIGLVCTNTENITIDDRTYFVYNISVGGGIGNMYYAPEAGMIVKMVGRFNDIIPFITDFDAELIEYSYP